MKHVQGGGGGGDLNSPSKCKNFDLDTPTPDLKYNIAYTGYIIGFVKVSRGTLLKWQFFFMSNSFIVFEALSHVLKHDGP